MLEEYDIDKLNPRPNPYAKELKKQITIKIATSVIEYFNKRRKNSPASISGEMNSEMARFK